MEISEIYFMPVLPASYYSSYYVVELDFWQFFERLGITTSFNSLVKILASNFEIELSSGMDKKLMVQGKPGILVQSVPSPTYTYTITAPIIIDVAGGNQGFLRFNCLNYLALNLANWQWQKLHHYPSDSDYNTDFISEYVILKKYTVNASENEIKQTLIIESNIPLTRNTNSEFWIDSYFFSSSDFPTQSNFYLGRLGKNYDSLVGFNIEEPGVSSYQFNLASSGIFLDDYNFDIEFEYEKHFLVNVGNLVTFNMKNYAITQRFGVTGFEQLTLPAYFSQSEYSYYNTLINLSLINLIFLRTELPMLCKSKKFILTAESLIKTDFEFNFDGAAFYPDYSNLFISDLA